MALILAEEEYMASNEETCEVIWMRKILVGLFGQMMDPIVIYCDNQSYIKLYENPTFHNGSKHIDICYHHLQDYDHRWIMLLQYIPIEEHGVHIFIKDFSRGKYEFHWCRKGVVDNPFIFEREC